jgi:hypothetical protein
MDREGSLSMNHTHHSKLEFNSTRASMGVETLVHLGVEPWPRRAPGGCREEYRKRRTYSAPRRYHRGMARQCLRGHDGTKPGEGADDTSARHHTHQHQISPRGRPSNSRRSSRSPRPRSKAQEATEPRAQGG